MIDRFTWHCLGRDRQSTPSGAFRKHTANELMPVHCLALGGAGARVLREMQSLRTYENYRERDTFTMVSHRNSLAYHMRWRGLTNSDSG